MEVHFTIINVELRYVVEWDGEEGSYLEVPQKRLIDAHDPSEGDAVRVQEGGSMMAYMHMIKRGGTYPTLYSLVSQHSGVC